MQLEASLLIVYTFLIVEQQEAIVRNRVLTHAYDFQTFGVVSVLKIVLQLFYPFVYSLAEERELLNAESVTLFVKVTEVTLVNGGVCLSSVAQKEHCEFLFRERVIAKAHRHELLACLSL